MTINAIRDEFVRRKLLFHYHTDYDNITLWGLFSWGAVSAHIKSGQIITHMVKENRTIWCRPSKEEIEKYIKPRVDKKIHEYITLKLKGISSF